MISYHNGDIFDSTANIICHQVNCMGVMGAGLAKQIKKKCPDAFNRYLDFVRKERHSKGDTKGLLGRCCIGAFDGVEEKYVANLFGQYNYGSDGRKYTNIKALEEAFVNCRNFAEVCDYSIAIPFGIGCGYGGADWITEVRPMIEDVFKGFKNEVEIWSYNG